MKCQFTYLNYLNDKYIPVPERVNSRLNAAKTPRQVSEILKETETILARNQGGRKAHDEYLQCDQVADLMVQVLKCKGIKAKGVVGYSREGSSHAWVEVGKRRYDPTEQGCYIRPRKFKPFH